MSLAEAKEFVNKTYTRDGCVGYTLLMEDGSNSGYHYNNCYGSISPLAVRKRHPVAVVNQLQTEDRQGYYKSLLLGTAEAYLSWLINESVFKDTFFETTVDSVITEGIWSTRCDIPGNVMVAAMTAVRMLTESGRSCRTGEVWLPLVEAGCTPEFAFVLGHYMEGVVLKTTSYDTHHCMLAVDSLSTDTVVNWCNKKFANPRVRSWNEDFDYSGVHGLFESGYNESFSIWLHKTYKQIKSGSTDVVGKESNPFSNATKTPEGVTMEADKFAVMAEVCDRFYKEFIK